MLARKLQGNTKITMKNGWIMLPREIMNNELYLAEKFDKIRAFLDLVMRASFAPTFTFIRGIRVDIQRGQLCASIASLAERWQWSRGKTDKYLNDLQNEKQIVMQKTNLTTLISIVNFDYYQQQYNAEYNAECNAEYNAKCNTINNNINNINNNTKDIGEKKTENFNYQEIVELWNNICISLPKVQKLSEARKRKIKIRAKEIGGIDKFQELFQEMENTPFLRGENERGWQATLDWLISNDNNYLKVIEGRYNKTYNSNGNKETRRKGFDVTATSAEAFESSF